jgi:hypothetical protein
MITDGKPSCVKEKDGSYYMNSNGLDDTSSINATEQARKLHIQLPHL